MNYALLAFSDYIIIFYSRFIIADTHEVYISTSYILSVSGLIICFYFYYLKLLSHISVAERGSLTSKSPLSPRTSTAPSMSNSSVLENLSVNRDKMLSLDPPVARRKSYVSLELPRRSKVAKEGLLDFSYIHNNTCQTYFFSIGSRWHNLGSSLGQASP